MAGPTPLAGGPFSSRSSNEKLPVPTTQNWFRKLTNSSARLAWANKEKVSGKGLSDKFPLPRTGPHTQFSGGWTGGRRQEGSVAPILLPPPIKMKSSFGLGFIQPLPPFLSPARHGHFKPCGLTLVHPWTGASQQQDCWLGQRPGFLFFPTGHPYLLAGEARAWKCRATLRPRAWRVIWIPRGIY